MKKRFSGIIVLLCILVGTALGGTTSGEGRFYKLEQFMRRIIILRETYSMKKLAPADNSEFDITSFKMTTVDKKIIGSDNHYNINGNYISVVRPREDTDSGRKTTQKNGASSRGDKHTFKAEVVEKGSGDFQVISFNRHPE